MRQDGEGRDTVFPWSDARESPRYAVGDVVFSGSYAAEHCRGSVVAVGDNNISVAWEGGEYGPITYPDDAGFLRKALPWEL